MAPPAIITRGARAVQLGRYLLVGRLASGATSTVYLARTLGEGGFAREFAVKVLHPHLDPSLRSRFLDEARLTSRVRHPNIVNVVELGVDRGLDYLVLEYVDGVDLRRLMLSRSVPLRPSQAALLVATVARGLHALHTAVDEHGQPMQAVHRDLSPHNLMIDRNGRVVLIDFGLAKLHARSEHTEVGVLCGRLQYMSPEQAQLQALDARSDVFSLGSVLFELLTGRLPFGDDDSRQTHERLLACDTTAIATLLHQRFAGNNPSDTLGKGLAEIVLTCLQREPGDRFGSAATLADAIEQQLAMSGVDVVALQRELAEVAAASAGGVSALPPAVLPAGASGNSRGRATRWLAAAGVAALLTTGAYGWRTMQRDATMEAAEREPPALAADAAPSRGSDRVVPASPPPPPAAPAPAALTVPVPMPTTSAILPAAVAAPEPGGAGQRRARRRARALKPNPYAP